ncbi:hypothetical protein jhhlp_000630 [Lomentospora prolificans]|uniref:Superoxide dismutase copper/zinc binding domain-containing protein n=1 Tax=Lomentospora prolificans TaxID=41688 RepID=A0A2N3NJ34_9PEZI|nr:hypothetical protein jhhlp_000630 [Lomentospora prolificans]
MCGHEITPKPRGGALAALNRPIHHDGLAVQGDLIFHSPGSPKSMTATHMRLTPSTSTNDYFQNYVIVIHEMGDLSRGVGECGHFCEFPLQSPPGTPEIDVALSRPVSLEVSNDGIIGRRVSLYSASPTTSRQLVAEGIIGFNMI